ncbi:MAG: RiPP maturation radical SAM C-methyltransferase [Actinomycetota bacterium]|nr:RiPP maturation radical SAM C-methyltransferase [Actinomycetota bacterium]
MVAVSLRSGPWPVQGAVERLAPEVRERRAAWPVALVAMPFGSALRPSIQLGLLAQLARSHGFPTETLHLNIDFAARIGLPLHEAIAGNWEFFLGDWLFSVAAFGDDAPDPEGRLLELFHDEISEVIGEELTATLRSVRQQQVQPYLDDLVEQIGWGSYRVVGFTTSFQQNVASIALARALKRRHPEVTVVFGGANLDGPMGRELVRSTPCIDLAVSGEADLAFPKLLAALADGGDPGEVEGVLVRQADGSVNPPVAGEAFTRMDDLPVPDYREYFERAERLGLIGETARRTTAIPFETARGCWWGAKRHCTFCGLNDDTISFRAKSPERVIQELDELSEQTRSYDLLCVDNILEPSYVNTLFARLRDTGSTYRFFWEIKADVKPDELRRLRDGGIRMLQPGIESLNSNVLRLMRKGTRAWQNVNLLRWGLHLGISLHWNILWGFPGETEADYQEQAALLRHLTHLQPPKGCGRIWAVRFSPIYEDRESFPAVSMEPEGSHQFVYPDHVDLDELAYIFTSRLVGALPDDVFLETRKLGTAWQDAWRGPERPSLVLWRTPGRIQIEDRRDPAAPGTHTFEGPLAAAYLACFDLARSARSVAETLDGHTPGEVEAALEGFVERGLMMRDGALYLALAVPAIGALREEPLSV